MVISMVGIDLLKKIKSTCISKKLGLYLRNPVDQNSYKYVKSLVNENYDAKLSKNENYQSELLLYLTDDYYSIKEKYDILKLSINKIVDLIVKNILVLEIIPSDNTLIADDDDYFLTNEKGEEYISKEKALINPIDEYEIEYKMLFLFNLLRDNKNKRDEIDVSFYDGYPDWGDNKHNVFDKLTVKTYKARKEYEYNGYQYYNNIDDEYNEKISDLKTFGKSLDKFFKNIDDYFKLDFIIETLLTANNSSHSIPLYTLIIEMLIINPKESIREQYKNKIKFFIEESEFSDENQIIDFSKRLYDIRSRLVHGNYSSLKKELKSFDRIYNKNAEIDTGEFKEENWILMSVSHRLRKIVINILKQMLDNKKKINDFKFDLIKSIEK